uniref:rRNA adenine N(6)-methyltransferase n=1 Tax=Graphocephala atropunctata TaxID=36148 RepID=A0A1B6L546_9HEMI
MSSISCCHTIKMCWNIEVTSSRWFSSSNLKIVRKKTKFKTEQDHVEAKEDTGVPKSKIKVTNRLNHYKTLVEYFESKQCLNALNKIPTLYVLRKFKTPKCLYIIDKDVAGQLFKAMEPHLASYNGHVIEANAGVGLLTTHLLEAGHPALRIYESDSLLYTELQDLLAKYNSNARLIKLNLLPLWTMIKLDQNDHENRFGTAFEGIAPCAWDSDPVMKIIVAVSSKNFIKHMIYSVVFQGGICVFGRPELLITMPSEEYLKLTALPSHGYWFYRGHTVLFRLLFEHTVLATVPEKAFVPWMVKSKQPNTKTGEDDGVMNLVRVSPRRDLFQMIPPHLIKPFWFFVHTMARNRQTKLIPNLEKWIPGIGVKLIAKGYNILTPVGSLSPEEFLEIFMEFSSNKEFSTCSFLPAMESLILRMTSQGLVEEIGAETTKSSNSGSVDSGEDSVLVYDDFDLENLPRKPS